MIADSRILKRSCYPHPELTLETATYNSWRPPPEPKNKHKRVGITSSLILQKCSNPLCNLATFCWPWILQRMGNFKLVTANPRQPLQQKKANQNCNPFIHSLHPLQALLQIVSKSCVFFMFIVFFPYLFKTTFSLPTGSVGSASPACRDQQQALPAASVGPAWPTAAADGKGSFQLGLPSWEPTTWNLPFFRGYNLPIYWGLKKNLRFSMLLLVWSHTGIHGARIFAPEVFGRLLRESVYVVIKMRWNNSYRVITGYNSNL